MFKQISILILGVFLLMTLSAQHRSVPTLTHSEEVQITPIDILNSPYRETNLSISSNGNRLFYMSDRGEQAWSIKERFSFNRKRRYDGDIWVSEKIDGEWQTPQSLGSTINTPQGEDEPNISPDDLKIYFQSWRTSWEDDGGPYYESIWLDDGWSEAEGLGGGITQFFQHHRFATDGMSMSPNDEYFIVASGFNYDGRMDLYLSKRQLDGTWTFPRPLSVNTKKDERSIFIGSDSRTIYFASDGYGGMGGLDIFKGVLQADGTVKDIMNVGAPINSEEDDYGFILSPGDQAAYFIREGDIYVVDLQDGDQRIWP